MCEVVKCMGGCRVNAQGIFRWPESLKGGITHCKHDLRNYSCVCLCLRAYVYVCMQTSIYVCKQVCVYVCMCAIFDRVKTTYQDISFGSQ